MLNTHVQGVMELVQWDYTEQMGHPNAPNATERVMTKKNGSAILHQAVPRPMTHQAITRLQAAHHQAEAAKAAAVLPARKYIIMTVVMYTMVIFLTERYMVLANTHPLKAGNTTVNGQRVNFMAPGNINLKMAGHTTANL